MAASKKAMAQRRVGSHLLSDFASHGLTWGNTPRPYKDFQLGLQDSDTKASTRGWDGDVKTTG